MADMADDDSIWAESITSDHPVEPRNPLFDYVAIDAAYRDHLISAMGVPGPILMAKPETPAPETPAPPVSWPLTDPIGKDLFEQWIRQPWCDDRRAVFTDRLEELGCPEKILAWVKGDEHVLGLLPTWRTVYLRTKKQAKQNGAGIRFTVPANREGMQFRVLPNSRSNTRRHLALLRQNAEMIFCLNKYVRDDFTRAGSFALGISSNGGDNWNIAGGEWGIMTNEAIPRS